jgi:3-hydroxyacyl-[acyl-carrier-protein] dehydratase
MNISEILSLLPHRYPMLMLDRVLECEPGKKVIAIKNVSINEPQFQGHFPSHPIMPGVLIVEAIAQAAGIIAITAHPDFTKKRVYLTGLDGFRFRRPVIPGDTLRITVEKIAEKRAIWKFSALVEVEGQRVAEGELLATVVDPT